MNLSSSGLSPSILVSALLSKIKFYTRTFYFSLPIWLFITYLKLIYSLTVFKLIPGISQGKVTFFMIFTVCPSFLLSDLKGQLQFQGFSALVLNMQYLRLIILTWIITHFSLLGMIYHLPRPLAQCCTTNESETCCWEQIHPFLILQWASISLFLWGRKNWHERAIQSVMYCIIGMLWFL